MYKMFTEDIKRVDILSTLFMLQALYFINQF
jgi:hypothetical protein